MRSQPLAVVYLIFSIAAHAAETSRAVLTRDAKARFGDLPGITAVGA